jgi:hypothetical protein
VDADGRGNPAANLVGTKEARPDGTDHRGRSCHRGRRGLLTLYGIAIGGSVGDPFT